MNNLKSLGQRDPVRRFSRNQKLAVEIVTGRTGEADHIRPYSKGGETSVENCQLIPRVANRKKAAAEFKPREWQKELLWKWRDREQDKPFMLIAVPGSGKTKVTLEIARQWLAAGADRRIIVVVPSDNLRKQWQDEALLFGIQLQTKEFGTRFKSDYMGGVTTYHLVANQAFLFRKLCSVAPTMVIFDEIHHCGDESHFGNGIKQAFELAVEKLLMSGTPWKTNGTPIPFVQYDNNGFAVGNFSYSLKDALQDGVVRQLVFSHSRGAVVNDVSGEVLEFNGNISEADAAKRLAILLDPNGDYVRNQVFEANDRLNQIRAIRHDAAALVICIDQNHAQRMATLIEEVTGDDVSLIVSDSAIENDTVSEFRKGRSKWLVSVRKVSEGTDIKRLHVLLYLTNVTAELFFRQAIGRVSRVRDEEDSEGFVILPADPRLIDAAKNVEDDQVLALNETSDTDPKERVQGEDGDRPVNSYSTTHDGIEMVFINGEAVNSIEYALVEQVSSSYDLPQAKVLRMIRDGVFSQVSQVTSEEVRPDESIELLEKRLRKDARSLGFKLSKILKQDVAEIHKRFKPQSEMSIRELEDKVSWLKKECAKK
jgi:superfamily II DNA or RNA helicase